MELISFVLYLYSLAVLAWIILSWIRVSSMHPLGKVQVSLDKIIYPVILPIRKVLPPLRLGGAMLDLSPIVLLIAIQLVRGIIT